MATTAEAAAQLIYPPNVQANTSLTTVKFISSCFAGATAGILGLENWLGFALFVASTLLTSICINTINCRGKPSKYIHGGLSELVNPGQDNAFTFILVWTLFYGIVHGATITHQDGVYTPANIFTWLSISFGNQPFIVSFTFPALCPT